MTSQQIQTRKTPSSPSADDPKLCVYSSRAQRAEILSKTSVHSQNTKNPVPRTQSTTRNLHIEAYQSPCKPKTGTAISSATPSTPATSALLPAALLLGADDDAPGALAVALPLAPVDDPSVALAVAEPEDSVAVVVAVVVDDAVPVEVSLSEMVGRVKPPSLVLVEEPPMMPVGVDVGVPSAALVAQ